MDLTQTFGNRPFTMAQVLDLGVTYRQWRRMLPELTRLRRGVYVVQVGASDRIRHAQQVSALLLTRADDFAHSASAVCLLGLPNPYFTFWDRVPQHTAGPRTRTARGTTRATVAPIPTPWGPCTDLIDTAVTIAPELPLPQALMVTDAVAARLAGTKDRFVLASEPCRTEVRRRLTHRHDHPALSLANPAAESPAESFYRGHMLLGGYRDPPCGVPRLGASGRQYFIDILLEGLAIEIDGAVKYRDAEALRAEKTREDDLRATGLAFHRVWADEAFADAEAQMRRLQQVRRERLALPA